MIPRNVRTIMNPSGSTSARRRVAAVIRRLEGVFGRQVWQRWGDGLEELVGTILSQHTSNINSDRAYERLATRFSSPGPGVGDSPAVDWNAVADAPIAAIERAIRCAGLSRIKAKVIRDILQRIRADRGEMSFEFLADWPVEKAREYLVSLKGIGPKTAACILLFSFHKPILPVDHNVLFLAQKRTFTNPKDPRKTIFGLVFSG